MDTVFFVVLLSRSVNEVRDLVLKNFQVMARILVIE